MKPEQFHLGVFQCNLSWEDTEQNIKKMETTLSTLTPGSMDLLVLPEMFSTGFSFEPSGLGINEVDGALNRFTAIAKKLKTHIAASFIFKDRSNYKNRFLLINENGVQSFYDKRHLFALGRETSAFTAGKEKTSWTLNGWKIAPFVCYDLRFPEWCRNDGTIDLTLFTANWPQPRRHHWKSLLVARAIENQCYVAGVNRIGIDGNKLAYSGDSLVLNANGETLLDAGNKEGVFVTTLSQKTLTEYREKFPFLRDRV